MKNLYFIFTCLIPSLTFAGAYEDMEAALIRREASTVIELIKRGIDVNSVDRAGNSLLVQAIRHDMPQLFDYLLERRARVNIRNRHGETALSIAAFTGKLNYAQRLVEAGAEVNFFGWPPLSYAAYNGHLAVAEYLLKHGADVDGKTENGSTALFFAARFGHAPVVNLLLKHNANPNVRNDNGDTPVDWALKNENTVIADAIRSAGGRSGKALVIEF